jgi:phosphatidylserine/phosphatidylglycerophosphate/cardiolipin synthase-like enzyme
MNFTGTYNVTLFSNPDNADAVIFQYLKSAQSSIYVSMYTISRPDFNKTLIDLKNSNPDIDIQVLISKRRVGSSENEDTYAAAKSLTDNSISVYNSTSDLNFYHNKYWIIDGTHIFIYSGNWSPRSVTPQLEPDDDEYASGEANRDMGIAIHEAEDIAAYFKSLWDADVAVADSWNTNTDWTPTTEITLLPFPIFFLGIISLLIIRRRKQSKK